MTDYPDFSIYDKFTRGKVQVITDSVILVSGHGISPMGIIGGPGFIYTLRIFVQNKVGAEEVLIYSKLDDEVIINNTFKEFQQMGAWQPGSGYVHLCQYDLVNGNFGLLLSVPTTFETSLYVSGSHTIGSDVTMLLIFQYSLLE